MNKRKQNVDKWQHTHKHTYIRMNVKIFYRDKSVVTAECTCTYIHTYISVSIQICTYISYINNEQHCMYACTYRYKINLKKSHICTCMNEYICMHACVQTISVHTTVLYKTEEKTKRKNS